MTILYALVAREKCVLAEHTGESGGDFPTVTRSLLSKIPARNEKMSIVYEGHVFHYIVQDDITFMCMSEEDQKRRVAFAFLMDVKKRWFATFGESGKTAQTFQMQYDFSDVLKKQTHFFNNASNDSMARVEAQLDEVKQVMVENIAKVLDKGEKLELMVDKTSRLSTSSKRFTTESNELKNAMWWHNMKVFLGISLCVIAIFVVFVLLAYAMLK